MKVKLEDIIFAIETADRYTENFLDQETGEIICINEMVMGRGEIEEANDRLDEHGFYQLPTSFEVND